MPIVPDSATPDSRAEEPAVRMGAVRKLAAWVGDYVWVIGRQVTGLLFMASGSRTPDSYANGDRAPIVLLPGVYETWQFLRPVADRLNRGGHPVHVVAALGYNRRTIMQSAELVSAFLVKHELRNVILVAHSKGGLIGKYVMTMGDKNFRIAQLVAVNSPFNGSEYARYFPLRSVRAFSPREPTLTMLTNLTEHNSRITSIYSTFDPHIPVGSAVAGAQNLRLPVPGHFQILSNPRLIDAVESVVDQRT